MFEPSAVPSSSARWDSDLITVKQAASGGRYRLLLDSRVEHFPAEERVAADDSPRMSRSLRQLCPWLVRAVARIKIYDARGNGRHLADDFSFAYRETPMRLGR